MIYSEEAPPILTVMDFLVLCNARQYVVYHLDAYQGANAFNVGIHEYVQYLHTTRKVVANSILCSMVRST